MSPPRVQFSSTLETAVMERVSKTVLFSLGLMAFTATASAEPGGNPDGNNRRWAAPDYQRWDSKRELYQHLANKFHKPKPTPIPIDPGRGDGKPVDPPHQPPQGPPGFVWVNGHWERVKAPTGPPVVVRDHRKPTPGNVIVRDHRTPSPGGVIVRDHRSPSPGGVIVRDHRTVPTTGSWQNNSHDASSHSGGVKVTDSAHPPVKHDGVQVRDHRSQ